MGKRPMGRRRRVKTHQKPPFQFGVDDIVTPEKAWRTMRLAYRNDPADPKIPRGIMQVREDWAYDRSTVDAMKLVVAESGKAVQRIWEVERDEETSEEVHKMWQEAQAGMVESFAHHLLEVLNNTVKTQMFRQMLIEQERVWSANQQIAEHGLEFALDHADDGAVVLIMRKKEVSKPRVYEVALIEKIFITKLGDGVYSLDLRLSGQQQLEQLWYDSNVVIDALAARLLTTLGEGFVVEINHMDESILLDGDADTDADEGEEE